MSIDGRSSAFGRMWLSIAVMGALALAPWDASSAALMHGRDGLKAKQKKEDEKLSLMHLPPKARQIIKTVADDIAKRGSNVVLKRDNNTISLSEEGWDVFERLRLWWFDPAKRYSGGAADHEVEVALLRWNGNEYGIDLIDDEKIQKHILVDGPAQDGLFWGKGPKGVDVVTEKDPRRRSMRLDDAPEKVGFLWFGFRDGRPLVFIEDDLHRDLTVRDRPKLAGENVVVELPGTTPEESSGFRMLSREGGIREMSERLATDKPIDRGSAFEATVPSYFVSEASGKATQHRVLVDKKSPKKSSHQFLDDLVDYDDHWLAAGAAKQAFVRKDDVSKSSPYFLRGEITDRGNFWEVPMEEGLNVLLSKADLRVVSERFATLSEREGSYLVWPNKADPTRYFIDKTTGPFLTSSNFVGEPNDKGKHWLVEDKDGYFFAIDKDDITRYSARVRQVPDNLEDLFE